MAALPGYLVLTGKVYQLVAEKTDERMWEYEVTDYRVEGVNPLKSSDRWRTLVGYSRELSDDYPTIRPVPPPLEWVLFRFLSHHVLGKTLEHLIDVDRPDVLTTTNFRQFLGRDVTDNEAKETVGQVFDVWQGTHPHRHLSLPDIYVSTDITLEKLKRGINLLLASDYLEETGEETYKVK